MNLLRKLPIHDSIGEMEAASDDRYWDALTCATQKREFIACYLMGYVAEMLLKTAYFRFASISAAADLAPHLKSVRKDLTRSKPPSTAILRASTLHNAAAWTAELIRARVIALRPLDPILAGLLTVNARWIDRNWAEVLRYRRSISATNEINRFLEVADWLITHHSQLWS